MAGPLVEKHFLRLPLGVTRRGALQLWQFLVTLLDDPTNSGIGFAKCERVTTGTSLNSAGVQLTHFVRSLLLYEK